MYSDIFDAHFCWCYIFAQQTITDRRRRLVPNLNRLFEVLNSGSFLNEQVGIFGPEVYKWRYVCTRYQFAVTRQCLGCPGVAQSKPRIPAMSDVPVMWIQQSHWQWQSKCNQNLPWPVTRAYQVISLDELLTTITPANFLAYCLEIFARWPCFFL